MIEQQVDIKVFIVHPDPLLPRNEGETIAEFEQEGFDLSQDRGFQLSLAVQATEQPRSRLSVRDVSWLHSACDQQPEGVHQNVALASFHALVRIESPNAAAFGGKSRRKLLEVLEHRPEKPFS
jgi:hypothetical protein